MSALKGQVKGRCPVRWLDHGRQVIAAPPEHVDLSTAGPIREQLLTIINRGAETLIADMSATVSCDHAGTETLARVCQRAAASGTELRLVVTAPVIRRCVADWNEEERIHLPGPDQPAAGPGGNRPPHAGGDPRWH